MDLEARIARLEDIEAIKQLKATYCDICDDNHNPGRIVQIFTKDGVWEGKGIAKATGHGEIGKLFERFRDTISFSQHMVQNPIIEIQGDEASATWYFLGAFTMRQHDQGLWQACRYHEKYRRTADGWKISHLQVRGPRMAAPRATG